MLAERSWGLTPSAMLPTGMETPNQLWLGIQQDPPDPPSTALLAQGSPAPLRCPPHTTQPTMAGQWGCFSRSYREENDPGARVDPRFILYFDCLVSALFGMSDISWICELIKTRCL